MLPTLIARVPRHHPMPFARRLGTERSGPRAAASPDTLPKSALSVFPTHIFTRHGINPEGRMGGHRPFAARATWGDHGT